MESPEPEDAKGISPRTWCLAWLGLASLNLIFSVAVALLSLVAWELGFAICFVYFFVVIALAVNLENAARQKLEQFINVLWVVACLLILVMGTYLSTYAIGPWQDSEGWKPKAQGDLAELLPVAASPLTSWAAGTSVEGADHAVFNGSVYFSSSDGGPRLLWQSHLTLTGLPTEQVSPGLVDAKSFIEFDGKLYFSARDNSTGSDADHLWYIDGMMENKSAVLVKAFESETRLGDFIVHNASSFYIKVSRTCSGLSSHSLFQSDGTASGTLDLDVGASCNQTVLAATDVRPPEARLFGELFLAVLPQTGLACCLLVFKKLPGLVVNIFGGIYAIMLLIWLLACSDLVDLNTFILWSLTAYSSVSYLSIAAMQLLRFERRPWLEDLTDWAVAVISAVFFGVIHVDLNIPLTTEASNWIIYAVLQLVQMLLGLVLQRRLPGLFGTTGILVTANKAAFEAVGGLATATGFGPGVKLMAQFATLAFLGLLVILAAVLSSSGRQKLEARLSTRDARKSPVEPLEPLDPHDPQAEAASKPQPQPQPQPQPKAAAAATAASAAVPAVPAPQQPEALQVAEAKDPAPAEVPKQALQPGLQKVLQLKSAQQLPQQLQSRDGVFAPEVLELEEESDAASDDSEV